MLWKLDPNHLCTVKGVWGNTLRTRGPPQIGLHTKTKDFYKGFHVFLILNLLLVHFFVFIPGRDSGFDRWQ